VELPIGLGQLKGPACEGHVHVFLVLFAQLLIMMGLFAAAVNVQ